MLVSPEDLVIGDSIFIENDLVVIDFINELGEGVIEVEGYTVEHGDAICINLYDDEFIKKCN
jgi:hypothetical protein